MGLIQKLKSALGLDGADPPESGTTAPRDVDVTVEREPSSESEDAVKGTETAGSETVETDEPDAGAGESTDDESPIEEAEPDVEDREEADTETADEETADMETADTEAADEAESEGSDDESADDTIIEPSDEPSDSVTEINGIGPAYGQRLSDAGVETVADLAAADAVELEEATDISAARIEGWIDAAAEY